VLPFSLFLACSQAGPLPPAPEDAGRDPGACDRVWVIDSGPDAIDPGVETYRATATRIPEGMGGFAIRFDPMAVPPAVHHAIVTRGLPDGDVPPPTIWALGRGTGALEMPPGVGMRLDDGEEIGLGVHVLNATDAPAHYDLRVAVCIVDDVEAESDVLVVGPDEIEIPPDGELHEFGATCPVEGDRTFFAAFPHMHALGTEIRVDVGGAPIAAIPWDFGDEPQIALDPPAAAADGDDVGVRCTYRNTGAEPVSWGPLATDEMCLAFLHYYPAGLRRDWACR
jgi:copper type II ascorbate-dependent monooxygenase-like protein